MILSIMLRTTDKNLFIMWSARLCEVGAGIGASDDNEQEAVMLRTLFPKSHRRYEAIALRRGT